MIFFDASIPIILKEESNTNRPELAVVLLSYNSLDLLRDFLPKILQTTPPEHEIVVVDNGSTDGTSGFMKENYPDTRVVRVEVNKGFTNGYKESLSKINAKHYALVSSDIEVTSGWTEPVVDLMNSDESIAICQPKIKSYHKKSDFEYAGAAGGFIDKFGYPFCRGRLFFDVEEDKGQYDDNMEIFWASGACFFIRSDVYHNLGGLDDDFFAHMEEIDLCWRAKNQGYKVMACPSSEVYHMGGYIINYGSPAKTYRNFRNNLILLTKNLPSGQLFPILILRLFLDGLAFWQHIVSGKGKSALQILKAHFHFHLGIFKWLKKRKEFPVIQNKRNTKGIYSKSIVWKYFIEKKKKFSELNWKP